MNASLLPAEADNQVKMFHKGLRADVLDVVLRRALSSGPVGCALLSQAF